MEFTGERYVPTVQGELRSEHLHRYAASMHMAKEKDVLDIACGEGYGSNLLSQVAQSVIGVDISPEVIAHASAAYGSRPNLKFLLGDCAQIPIPSNYIDLVVSFETIEHHARHEEMMLEICRVLRPEGILFISSPNKRIYSDAGGYKNPHHVKELYLEEFDILLRRHFRSVMFFGQRMATASFVFPLNDRVSSYQAYSEHQGTIQLGSIPMQRVFYFLALCTNSAHPSPLHDASVYFDLGADFYLTHMAEVFKARTMMEELGRLPSSQHTGKD